MAANMSGISWTTTSAAPAKSSKVSTGGRQAVSREAFAEFITRAFEEDMAIGLDMPPQEKYTSTSSGVRTTTTRDMSKESAM